MHGAPSNSLFDAGIVVRQIDALTQFDSTSGGPWGLSANRNYSDRLSASVVNSAAPYMFSTSAIGFILRPSDLKLFCSYIRDGNSMDAALNGEKHGCGGVDFYGKPLAYLGMATLKAMMTKQLSEMRPNAFCVWKGAVQDSADRSDCQYNELVIAGHEYQRGLPGVIEAIFYPTNGPVHHAEGSSGAAKKMQRLFLDHYGLGAGDVPLLAFDVTEARSRRYDSRPWRPG